MDLAAVTGDPLDVVTSPSLKSERRPREVDHVDAYRHAVTPSARTAMSPSVRTRLPLPLAGALIHYSGLQRGIWGTRFPIEAAKYSKR